MDSPYKVLFVCMGNICRSPAAEGVMLHMLRQNGLEKQVQIDSAGTGGWHSGNRADERMRKHAALRGYSLDSRARQVRESDFEHFDLILVMDRDNMRQIKPFSFSPRGMHKVRLFCEFARDRQEKEVPDPYYGGDDGFEQVLDIVENGCEHLLRHIRKQIHA